MKVYDFWLQWSIILGFSIILTIGVLINWKFGLKKFEAFG